MPRLIESEAPYAGRDEAQFLAEMNDLVAHHRHGCEPYARLTGATPLATRVEELPFVHVGLFKHIELVTAVPGPGARRTVMSSSTSGTPSRVSIDEHSAALQAISSRAILADFIGQEKRPLLILDSVDSLRRRGEFSARILAAMSLKPFASETFFLLKDAGDAASLQVAQVACALKHPGPLMVYGFSWVLWLAWTQTAWPEELRRELRTREVTYVHSGGWKKLEAARVARQAFDESLLAIAGPGSQVLDYYGLVEQMGVVYPLCQHGARHVPRWAEVLVRDSWSLEPLADAPGQLQLLNTLNWGTPSHSVLTEDTGRLLPGPCPCGRSGRRFELLGRLPKAELRGCANV